MRSDEEKEKVFTWLRSLNVFGHFHLDCLGNFAARLRPYSFKAGDKIVKHRFSHDPVFIIYEGEVENKTTKSIIKAGQLLYEVVAEPELMDYDVVYQARKTGLGLILSMMDYDAIIHDFMVANKFRNKALLEDCEIFSDKIMNTETFLMILNKLKCFFAKQGTIVYENESVAETIFFLINGKAKVEIKTKMENQQKIRTVIFCYDKK